jgi:YD repeat-containing protein
MGLFTTSRQNEWRGPNGELKGGYGYNAYHQPTSFTNAVGEVTSYTYTGDAYHRLLTTTFPSTLVSSNSYGSDGYLSKTVDYVGGSPYRTNSYTWLNGMPRTHTDARGMTQTFTYDALHRIKQIEFGHVRRRLHSRHFWTWPA